MSRLGNQSTSTCRAASPSLSSPSSSRSFSSSSNSSSSGIGSASHQECVKYDRDSRPLGLTQSKELFPAVSSLTYRGKRRFAADRRSRLSKRDRIKTLESTRFVAATPINFRKASSSSPDTSNLNTSEFPFPSSPSRSNEVCKLPAQCNLSLDTSRTRCSSNPDFATKTCSPGDEPLRYDSMQLANQNRYGDSSLSLKNAPITLESKPGCCMLSFGPPPPNTAFRSLSLNNNRRPR
mmetsp:Transcript_19138/g.39608  ORF Transcript_19138/g.39608 Transcript_19138/m.39608 type:complete len:236 (-) Transcript_19138:3368-4075(-)